MMPSQEAVNSRRILPNGPIDFHQHDVGVGQDGSNWLKVEEYSTSTQKWFDVSPEGSWQNSRVLRYEPALSSRPFEKWQNGIKVVIPFSITWRGGESSLCPQSKSTSFYVLSGIYHIILGRTFFRSLQ